jgi:hypothetical protein
VELGSRKKPIMKNTSILFSILVIIHILLLNFKAVSGQRSGLEYRICYGYHDAAVTGNPDYCQNKVLIPGKNGVSNGYSVDLENLQKATNGNVIEKDLDFQSDNDNKFSMDFVGYFYTGKLSGQFTFTLATDDGSYIWLGNDAHNNFAISNALIDNGGRHGPIPKSSNIHLLADTFYPLRILYGNYANLYEMKVWFTTPGGISYTDGTGFYFTSVRPSGQPSKQPSSQPSMQPSSQPTMQPSSQPTMQPSQPSSQPSIQPSSQPTMQPSSQPSSQPSIQPTSQPSMQPSSQPSRQPSSKPSMQPSSQPTMLPSSQPSRQPSSQPSMKPSSQPSRQPSGTYFSLCHNYVSSFSF